jgi:hypothetical protein
MYHFAPMPAVIPMTDVHMVSVFNHVESEEYFGTPVNDPMEPTLFTDEDFTEQY